MKRLIILLSVVHLLTGCATYKYKKQGFVSNTAYFKEIPFTYENGFILLPITIEGKEYDFILDTGAELNLIDPTIANELTLKQLKKGTVSNGEDSHRNISRVEIGSIHIGGIEFQETVAMIWDISKFSKHISCKKIDGFIGNNLMRKSNWQIDYQKKIVRISDSGNRLDISDSHQKIKMNSGFVGNVHLNLKIGEKYKDFTFDTGYNGFAQTGDTTLLRNIPSIEKIGVTGANFTGSKDGRTYYKVLDTFSISNYVFKSPTYFSIKPGNSSVLGNKFFENYVVTIDWDADYIILDQVDAIEFKASNIYEVGFFPDFDNGVITIANVYEKSSLMNKVSPKSKVLKINNIDLIKLAEANELCEFWSKRWESITKKDVLSVIIDHNGKEQKIEVKKIKQDW